MLTVYAVLTSPAYFIWAHSVEKRVWIIILLGCYNHKKAWPKSFSICLEYQWCKKLLTRPSDLRNSNYFLILMVNWEKQFCFCIILVRRGGLWSTEQTTNYAKSQLPQNLTYPILTFHLSSTLLGPLQFYHLERSHNFCWGLSVSF